MSHARLIRLLIVDDHPVVRNGLLMVEQVAADVRIVGAAASVEEGWAQIQKLQPDVVSLDLRLPDGDGLELCRRARARYPNIRFLCLTSYADASLVLAAMEAGVDGYLLKHSDAHHIAAAVREVLAGTPVFDPALDVVSARDEAGRASRNPLSFLSPGEKRVLCEVAKGLTDKEVSNVLNLSAKTVRHTLDRAFAKLGVHTRTQAAMLYAEHGRQD